MINENNRVVNAYHIFAPVHWRENWVEQILGEVIAPVWEVRRGSLDWVWVTRYVEPLESTLLATTPPDETRGIPDDFVDSQRLTRRVIFRAAGDNAAVVRKGLLGLSEKTGCHVRITLWDIVEDLGSDRFIQSNATIEQRMQRADLVGRFVDAGCQLMFDAVTLDHNSQWTLERNTHQQNPTGSFFFSVHHLFCNLTNLQIPVQVMVKTHFSGAESVWVNVGS